MIMILVGWRARSESGCFCRQRPGLNFGIFVMVCSTFLPPPPPLILWFKKFAKPLSEPASAGSI